MKIICPFTFESGIDNYFTVVEGLYMDVQMMPTLSRHFGASQILQQKKIIKNDLPYLPNCLRLNHGN